MSKSRFFVFVVGMTIAMLLVVGNLIQPAQANAAGIITSVPTGTPINDSNDQNEPIFVKEQEEIKTVIYSYFDMRYGMLSVSQLHGFSLGGFGNIVSDRPDAKKFLETELGKLALEIKYAELNHSKYVDYKYFLDFSDFTLDSDTQLITVSVTENNEIISENSAKGNPPNPHVAQMHGLKHVIVLHKGQNQWKIVSDHYNDFLWRTIRQTGESPEETLSMLNAVETPPSLEEKDENSQTGITSLLPDNPSSHSYDRVGAVNYALTHAWPENYNRNYPSYDDENNGDCTNFVSQALYEGGNISLYIPTSPVPGIEMSGWYLLNDMERASDWNDVNRFYELVATPDGRRCNSI